MGDRAHRYLKEVQYFVDAVARSHGLTTEDLERVADLFEMPERFPGRISPEEVRDIVLSAVKKGEPMAALEHPRIAPLVRTWRELLEKNLERIEMGEYASKTARIGEIPVKIVIYHVPEDEAKRVQKIKSAVGSYLLDKFANSPEPVIVAAGQLEPGDVINYRIGANTAAVNAGLHAGDIARELAGRFGLSGGGHAVVAGAKIPHSEKDRILEHMEEAIHRLYGKE